MGLLDWFTEEWKPREGMVYKYKKWHRRKKIVWRPPMAQGLDPTPEGTRSRTYLKFM